jgi:nitronate monooxygenase
MWPDNRFIDLVGSEHPIIQAPMAGSSSVYMAVAVSEAGGLGSLACATLDVEELREELASAGRMTDKPLNVNFFAHAKPKQNDEANAAWLKRLSGHYGDLGVEVPGRLAPPIQPFDDARCAVVEEFAPAVVSFHFGLPEKRLLRRLEKVGCKIISSATTVAEAKWLADQGCSAVIAQGYEAGGHRGMFLTDDINTQLGTFALVPQIVDAVDAPVIAAGGIADERGIVAALALGASAVQIGTAYLFTREATVNPLYENALREAGQSYTTVTNVFSGRPTRCLVNQAIREIGPMASEAPTFPLGFAAMGPLRKKAEAEGRRDFSAHYCGQAAPLGYATTSAALTRTLSTKARQQIAGMSIVGHG